MKARYLVLFLNISINAIAQRDLPMAYWFKFQPQYEISKKLSINGEFDYRRFLKPNIAWQSYNHLRLNYRFKPHWETAVGLGVVALYKGSLIVPELRPYQDLYYLSDIKKIEFNFRLRLEERNFHNFNSDRLTPGYNTKVRLRLRAQISKNINSKHSFRLSEEVLFQTKDGFNQNQIWLTSTRDLGGGFSLDLAYMKAFLKSESEFWQNRNNLRFTINMIL